MPRPYPLVSRLLLAGSLLWPVACRGADEPLSEAARRQRIDALVEEYRRELPAVPELTPAQVLARRQEGETVVLVDVRTAPERRVSTLPGALTPEELEARRPELSSATIVAYCTIGYRSAEVTTRLREEGWQAFNLAGSVLAWTHEGLQLVTPEGEPTRTVHVYGEAWNLVADGYEAVW